MGVALWLDALSNNQPQGCGWVLLALLYLGASLVAHASALPGFGRILESVSYTHLRAHETLRYLVCRLLLEKKK